MGTRTDTRQDADVWTDTSCTDCGDPLRFGDEARCRWCEQNRAVSPQDYQHPGSQEERTQAA